MRDFDKSFKRMRNFVVGAWIVGALMSLTGVGVVIWAIITLVNKYVSS